MTVPVPQFRIRTRMSARERKEASRTPSPLELLFDLSFVVAIAQATDELGKKIEAGHAPQGIVPVVMVFFTIWWAWHNFTWFASAYDADYFPYRLLTFLQIAGALVLAAGVPTAFEHQNFFGITLGYFLMRIGLVAQWVRAAIENPDGRVTAIHYAVGVTVIQLLWLPRLMLPSDAANLWWTVYLAFEVLVLIFGLWWLNYPQPGGAGLALHRNGSLFWGYGHYFTLAAPGSLGAGLQVAVRLAVGTSTVSPPVVAEAVAIPVAPYLRLLARAHLRILLRLVVNVVNVVPVVIVVLLLLLLTDSIGLFVVFALIAVLAGAAVAATLALGRHMFGAEQ